MACGMNTRCSKTWGYTYLSREEAGSRRGSEDNTSSHDYRGDGLTASIQVWTPLVSTVCTNFRFPLQKLLYLSALWPSY
eukprot:737355-Rhodomonas_salina.3